MKANLFQHTVRWVLATVCLSMMVESSSAGSFAQQCAVRDMQVLMSVEERQSASAISADKVSDAIFALVNARMVCQKGNVVDALSIYDSLAEGIAVVLVRQSGNHRTPGAASGEFKWDRMILHDNPPGTFAITTGAFTRGCAARDLQILALVTKFDSARAISAEKQTDVMLKMLHARMVCHEGNVMDALAIYDSIAESITAVL
jgi:hypothetical protein